MRGKVNPGFWFYTNYLPSEVRDLLKDYWQSDLSEEELPEYSPQEVHKHYEALLGQSLARAMLHAEQRIKNDHQMRPEKRDSLEAGLQWISQNMKSEMLPGDYQEIYRQYVLEIPLSSALQWFWQGIPMEIEHALRVSGYNLTPQSKFSGNFLALALAKSLRLSREEERMMDLKEEAYRRRHEDPEFKSGKRQSSNVKGVGDWIRDRMDGLLGEISEKILKDPDSSGFLREFLYDYQQALAQESRDKILADFRELDANLIRAIERNLPHFEYEIRESLPMTNPQSQNLRALGRSVGDYLNDHYVGLLTFGERTGLVPSEELGVSSKTLQKWVTQIYTPDEIQRFVQTLIDDFEGLLTYRDLVSFVLSQKEAWGSYHPFILGVEEAFGIYHESFDPWQKLAQINELTHKVQHAPAMELAKSLPPEIQAHVMANWVHIEPSQASDFTFSFAEVLAMTLAQANGVVEEVPRGSYRLKHTGLTEVPLRTSLHPLEWLDSQKFRAWFVQMAQETRQAPFADLQAILMDEITNYSSPGIIARLPELPEPVFRNIIEELPRFGSHEMKGPILKTLQGEMIALGHLLGYFLHGCYMEIFRLGAEKGWIRPEDYRVQVDNVSYLGVGEGDLLFEAWPSVTPEFIRAAFQTQEWLFHHLRNWGGQIHPMWYGFTRAFQQGGLQLTTSSKAREAAEKVLKELESQGA